MESARATEGDDAFFQLYWEAGTRIHHDRRCLRARPTVCSSRSGLDASHAAAFDDESWDKVIRAGMDEGLALVGNDVGTPIIAITNSDGREGRVLRAGHHEGAARPRRASRCGMRSSR